MFSSEDEEADANALLVAAMPPPRRRQRQYGKRRPGGAVKRPAAATTSSARRNRPSRPFLDDDSSFSSSPPRKKRPPMPRKTERLVIESASDESSLCSKELAKKPHASNKPQPHRDDVRSTSSGNAKDNDNDQVARTRALPSLPKRRNPRPPIRVNLTPDRLASTRPANNTDNHHCPQAAASAPPPPSTAAGTWLTKSQLLGVARRHQGMAIQYRVMYHSSQKPIKDHNTAAKRKIRYKDLVVQSRFACATGSFGGCTYSFMQWKLPGTLMLLQSLNKRQHVTIYADTRPRLFLKQGRHEQNEDGRPAPSNNTDSISRTETDHPLIVLCSELSNTHRRMAERFLCHANAGMTPQEFYTKQHQASTSNQEENVDTATSDDVTTRTADATNKEKEEDKENQSRPPQSQDVQDDEVAADDDDDAGYEGEPEPSPTEQASMSFKVLPLSSTRSSDHASSGSKRDRDGDNGQYPLEGKRVKRAKKKGYGRAGRISRRRATVTFCVAGDQKSGNESSSSSSPQFLALIEGIAGLQCSSDDTKQHPSDHSAEDYVRDVFMNGRVEKLPNKGRLLELPGEAKAGTWTGALVDSASKANSRIGSGKGMMRDKLGNLKDVRIQLRHESVSKTMVGPLKLSGHSEDSVSPLSDFSPIVARIRGGGDMASKKQASDVAAGTVVSAFDPSHGRRHDIITQAVVSKTGTLGRQEPFVGSISIAAFDGFTSSADARLYSGEKSIALLESCRKRLIENEADTFDSTGILEDVLPIPASCSATDGLNIGVSFICKIALEETYKLLVAHDELGRIVAVDVLFDTALVDNNRANSSPASTASHQNDPIRLTEGVLRRHSEDLDRAVPEEFAGASSEFTDENAPLIMDNHFEEALLCNAPPAPPTDVHGREDIIAASTASMIDPTNHAGKSAPLQTMSSHRRSNALKSSLKHKNDSLDMATAPLIANTSMTLESSGNEMEDPESILKKKNVTREVKPTPKTTNTAKKFFDWSSSDDGWSDEIHGPSATRVVSTRITLTPRPEKQTIDKVDGVSEQFAKVTDDKRGSGMDTKKRVQWSSSDERSNDDDLEVLNTIRPSATRVVSTRITPAPRCEKQTIDKVDCVSTQFAKVTDDKRGSGMDTKKRVPWSSSDEWSNDDEFEVLDTIRPLSSMSPDLKSGTERAAGKANGFLSRLESAIDTEPEATACTSAAVCNTTDNYLSDDNAFTGRTHVDDDDLGLSRVGHIDGNSDSVFFDAEKSTTQGECAEVLSPSARWPSVHDVFFGGLYDPALHVECSSEELQDFCEPDDIQTTSPFLSILHEFCFGPDDSEDTDSVSSYVPATNSKRRRFIRCAYMPVARLLFLAFICWQASLVPNDSKIVRVVHVRSLKGAKQPSSNMLPTTIVDDLTRSGVFLDDFTVFRQSWSDLLVGGKYW